MNMVIIEAGTTTGSEYANPNRKPPLSNDDLLRMFNKPAYHIPTIDASYNLFFSKALELYVWWLRFNWRTIKPQLQQQLMCGTHGVLSFRAATALCY